MQSDLSTVSTTILRIVHASCFENYIKKKEVCLFYKLLYIKIWNKKPLFMEDDSQTRDKQGLVPSLDKFKGKHNMEIVGTSLNNPMPSSLGNWPTIIIDTVNCSSFHPLVCV